jgi:hypothetical protein
LTLHYVYKSKVSFIAPNDYKSYLSALKKVNNKDSYSIYKSDPLRLSSANPDSDPSWLLYVNETTVLFSYAGLYLLTIILWLLESRNKKEPANALFYPVSIYKLIVMCLLTIGIYPIYWFYKNFSFIKELKKDSSIPIARGIFNAFWYYTLWKELKQNSEKHLKHPYLPSKLIAIIFSVLFFIAYLVSNEGSLTFVSILATPLLLIPLANYIIFVNGENSPALETNSKWSLRHYLLALISLPSIVFIIGSDLSFFPDGKVVKGNKILEYNVKFMQRKGIINPGDSITYFYSDAFLFISDDGNGFTENNVFSYWKDEDGTFNQELAEFEDIHDIKVDWSNDSTDYTTITILRKDGSDFLLFISNTDNKDKTFVNTLKERWKGT